jgi:hypothetical protein
MLILYNTFFQDLFDEVPGYKSLGSIVAPRGKNIQIFGKRSKLFNHGIPFE